MLHPLAQAPRVSDGRYTAEKFTKHRRAPCDTLADRWFYAMPSVPDPWPPFSLNLTPFTSNPFPLQIGKLH